MKRCPTCNRTYADNALSFCLEDGALLSPEFDEEETVAFSKEYPNPAETDPNFRTDKSVATVVSPRINTSPSEAFNAEPDFDAAPGRKNNTPHFIYAGAGLLAVVVVGWLFLSRSNPSLSETAAANTSHNAPAPTTNANKIEIRANPSPTVEPTAAPLPTKTPDKIFNFPANRSGWHSIGSGPFIVSVDGQINIGGVTVSPVGWSRLGDNTAMVAGLPFGAVIGRVGNERPFLVGNGRRFDTQDEVHLAINDSTYSDNSGRFIVRVEY